MTIPPHAQPDDADEGAERFRLLGRVHVAGFPHWIARHGARLGLQLGPVHRGQDAEGQPWLSFTVTGPMALRDAMEMGCSLGPWDAWVDRIDRTPLSASHTPSEETA